MIEALANAPSFTEVEVTIRDGNAANDLTRKVIRVERRHDSKTGKEVVSLICFKSLKEQKAYEKTAYAVAHRIKAAKRQAEAQAAQDRPAPELTKAPKLKEAPDVKPLSDVEPMELKPMELKPMKLKEPTYTFADFGKAVKEQLARIEASEEQQADSTD